MDNHKIYHIMKHCFTCGACYGVCPAACIEHTEFDKYKIDPTQCTGCGLCVQVCPAEAIEQDPLV